MPGQVLGASNVPSLPQARACRICYCCLVSLDKGACFLLQFTRLDVRRIRSAAGGGCPSLTLTARAVRYFFRCFPAFSPRFPRSRSFWHGVSSQGMLYVGPLGDDSEALRLESMAGRGGGSSNARSVHAIRCFNAQVTHQGHKRHNILHNVAVCHTCDSTIMGVVPTLYGAKRGILGELHKWVVSCRLVAWVSWTLVV